MQHAEDEGLAAQERDLRRKPTKVKLSFCNSPSLPTLDLDFTAGSRNRASTLDTVPNRSVSPLSFSAINQSTGPNITEGTPLSPSLARGYTLLQGERREPRRKLRELELEFEIDYKDEPSEPGSNAFAALSASAPIVISPRRGISSSDNSEPTNFSASPSSPSLHGLLPVPDRNSGSLVSLSKSIIQSEGDERTDPEPIPSSPQRISSSISYLPNDPPRATIDERDSYSISSTQRRRKSKSETKKSSLQSDTQDNLHENLAQSLDERQTTMKKESIQCLDNEKRNHLNLDMSLKQKRAAFLHSHKTSSHSSFSCLPDIKKATQMQPTEDDKENLQKHKECEDVSIPLSKLRPSRKYQASSLFTSAPNILPMKPRDTLAKQIIQTSGMRFKGRKIKRRHSIHIESCSFVTNISTIPRAAMYRGSPLLRSKSLSRLDSAKSFRILSDHSNESDNGDKHRKIRKVNRDIEAHSSANPYLSSQMLNRLMTNQNLFLQELLKPDMKLVQELCNSSTPEDLDVLCRSIVRLYETHGITMRLLIWAIVNEVHSTSTASTLFREDSLASKFMYVKYHGSGRSSR
jgi:hypothetical protein